MTTELYLMYLRKSRADRDYVDESVMNTLKRHKARLDELCVQMRIVPDEVLYEVASGESIASRPEMMRLLSLVETGKYAAVICVDMDRLSRGSGADQALVINTFKYSNTKIITPYKTYDFSNETDEQFAELGLFIAKSEYRTIRRRMLQGRIDAIKEGKYSAGNAPYGYEVKKLKGEKGYVLAVVPEEAKLIPIIFGLYIEEKMGAFKIAQWLKTHGYRNRAGEDFKPGHINKILADPTYTGKIRFQYRITKSSMVNGRLVKKEYNNNENMVVTQGRHEALISQETFSAAALQRSRNFTPHCRMKALNANPFVSMVVCSRCGARLQLRSVDQTGMRALFCPTVGCPTISVYLPYFEEAVLNALGDWLKNYEVVHENAQPLQRTDIIEDSIKQLTESLKAEEKRLERIYDLFESGTYEAEEFKERSYKQKVKIREVRDNLSAATENLAIILKQNEARENVLPTVRTIVDEYEQIPTAAEKNKLLRSVIDHIDYEKTAKGRTHGKEFKIVIHPVI